MVTEICFPVSWSQNIHCILLKSTFATKGIILVGFAILIVFVVYYLIYKKLVKEMKEKEAHTLFEQGKHTFESNEFKLAYFFFERAGKRYEEIQDGDSVKKCDEYMGKISRR
jgi:hypothetical protein